MKTQVDIYLKQHYNIKGRNGKVRNNMGYIRDTIYSKRREGLNTTDIYNLIIDEYDTALFVIYYNRRLYLTQFDEFEYLILYTREVMRDRVSEFIGYELDEADLTYQVRSFYPTSREINRNAHIKNGNRIVNFRPNAVYNRCLHIRNLGTRALLDALSNDVNEEEFRDCLWFYEEKMQADKIVDINDVNQYYNKAQAIRWVVRKIEDMGIETNVLAPRTGDRKKRNNMQRKYNGNIDSFSLYFIMAAIFITAVIAISICILMKVVINNDEDQINENIELTTIIPNTIDEIIADYRQLTTDNERNTHTYNDNPPRMGIDIRQPRRGDNVIANRNVHERNGNLTTEEQVITILAGISVTMAIINFILLLTRLRYNIMKATTYIIMVILIFSSLEIDNNLSIITMAEIGMMRVATFLLAFLVNRMI